MNLSPKEAYPHFGRALARRDLKNYQGTIQDCTDALELGGKKSVYYTLRADAHLALQDSEAATKDYTDAIENDRNNHDPYPRLERAKILHAKKEFDRAIIDYKHVLDSDSNNAEALQGRARAFYENGEPGKALADFDAAARLEPRVAQHRYWRGVIFFEQRLFEEAFKEADIALEDKDFAAAYGLRGIAMHYCKDTDKNDGKKDKLIRFDLDEAVRRDPADPGNLLWRARFYYDRKEYADALKDLDRALKLDENYIEAHRDRAEVCEKIDKSDDAAKERKRVEELEAQANSAPRSKPGFMAERFFGKVPGATDKRLRQTTIAQKPPAAEKLMHAEALAMAEKAQPAATEIQRLVAKVGVADLLPEPCASLDKTFQQAQDSFRKEEYERGRFVLPRGPPSERRGSAKVRDAAFDQSGNLVEVGKGEGGTGR